MENKMLGGFTLIELLVVVLIIGILSSVALPQYQRVVEKSRSVEAVTLLKSAYQTAQNYYLANGEWPTRIDQLDIEFPTLASGAGGWVGSGSSEVGNEHWNLNLYDNSNHSLKGVCAGRISGKYAGAGFCMFIVPETYQGQVMCVERASHYTTFSEPAGSYCNKLFGGTYLFISNMRVYSLP